MKSDFEPTWFGLFKKTAHLAIETGALGKETTKFVLIDLAPKALNPVVARYDELLNSLNTKLLRYQEAISLARQEFVARHLSSQANTPRASDVVETRCLDEAQTAMVQVVEAIEGRFAAQNAWFKSVMEGTERMQERMILQVEAMVARERAFKNYTISALEARDTRAKDDILAAMVALLDSEL